MMTYYVSPDRMARRAARLNDAYRSDVHIPVDVIVEDDTYVITAFVPGIDPKDVRIEIIENTVSIEGDFLAIEAEDVKYLLNERPTGAFSRTLRLPATLDAGQADAEVVNGVLTLRVSKSEEAKAKLVKVKSK